LHQPAHRFGLAAPGIVELPVPVGDPGIVAGSLGMPEEQKLAHTPILARSPRNLQVDPGKMTTFAGTRIEEDGCTA
jgi:hypothetical protein